MSESTPQINAALSNPRADMALIDTLERKLFSLGYAIDEVASLGPVIDPANATRLRGEALAVLEQERVEAISDPEIGAALERLEKCPELLDKTRQAQLRVLQRDRRTYVSVPAEEQAAFMRLTCEANDVWRRAKPAGDWESFAPYLDNIVESLRSMATQMDAHADPYDMWLDQYEPGSNQAFYDVFFEKIREAVVPLLADVVASRHQPSAACVEGHFDEERQWSLATELLQMEGLNEDALWVGRTEHPFTGGPSRDFVIVTGHAYANNVLSNVYSILHEGGHALYEQNVAPELAMTSLRGGTSMGMHESQSRFFENVVGRSEAFATPLLEALRRHFPGRFARVTPHQLFLAANRVEPGFIRTEADELTYPLHVLVRYEIEKLLITGEAKAADVPKLWAERYKNYLGVDVPNHTMGALQDTHWSDGSIGYFPTYALGSAIACQLADTMTKQGIDLTDACAQADFTSVRAWLCKHVWRYGRSRNSDEILREACGVSFSPDHYVEYLTSHFSSLYRL